MMAISEVDGLNKQNEAVLKKSKKLRVKQVIVKTTISIKYNKASRFRWFQYVLKTNKVGVNQLLTFSFKVGLLPSKKNYFICCNKHPLKMMKKRFCFISKALFVVKIFNFFILAFKSSGLIKQIKFMTSQPCLQTIKIHIVSNISRSKSDQTEKFGQLRENNKRDIFI